MVKPRGSISRSAHPKKGYEHLYEPQFEIAAWCPDNNAQLPPTQIHLIVHWPYGWDLPPMAIRFKGPDTLGFMIEELIRYRRIVWSDCERITGEKQKRNPGETLSDEVKAIYDKIENYLHDTNSEHSIFNTILALYELGYMK